MQITPAFPVPVSNIDLQASTQAIATALTQLVSLSTHAMVGLTTAHGLEVFKNTGIGGQLWGLLTSKRAKNLVAATVAFLGSLGVTTAMQGYDAHTGSLTLVISGLTAASLWTHLGSFLESWILQRTAYVAFVQPRPIAGAPEAAPVPVVPVIPIPSVAGGH
jgi:hypothetical protein